METTESLPDTTDANRSKDADNYEPGSMLTQLGLSPSRLAGLPPEWRDRLLDYLAVWGPAEELARVAETLREAHGPLLHLLDYLALARFQQGRFEESLDILERRQRRSPVIAGQVMEARSLMALGHDEHALDMVEELSRSYPRNIAVLACACEIFDRQGNFESSRKLLEEYLASRSHDTAGLLQMALHAYRAKDMALADRYLQQLGAGVPAAMDSRDMRAFFTLLTDMERPESAQAIYLELERRRQAGFEELATALNPLQAIDREEDAAEVFHRLSGPASIEVDRSERRKIQLEAVRHFGYMELRAGQTEVIAGVLRGESLLTVMPTGAGKSLCYQLPALILPHTTLVISPLVALMKDQVEGLPAAARALATFINSTLSDAEMAQRLQGIADGAYKLIYAAPERLRQLSFLAALRKARIGLFVLDEAHCVSLWGHDFRPDYLFIQEARNALDNPPALAMTATAPPRVRDEIIDYIRNAPAEAEAGAHAGGAGLTGPTPSERPRVLTLDIFRHNLHLSAIRFHNEEDKLAATLKLVTELEGSGIVYVNSRHKCESVAFELRSKGVAAEAYHAGIEGRGAIQDRFMAGQTRVVVATVAFGMGIDKADIRFIIHFHPARSLAAYYQEVGRAGRDGKPSQGILFYSNNDWSNLRRWAKSGEMSVDFLERVYAAVATQLGVHVNEESAPVEWEPVGGPVDARRVQQILNVDETTVRVALSILERADLLTRGFDLPQEFTIVDKRPTAAKRTARGKSAASGAPAAKGAHSNGKAASDEAVLLDEASIAELNRLRKGLALSPGEAATFKITDLANFMHWPLEGVEPGLLEWDAAGELAVYPARRAMFINLPARAVDMRERLERILNQSIAIAQRRIDDIVGYATGETCRHGYISAHFGSPPRTKCTVCDNCTGVRPEVPVNDAPVHALPDDADVEPMILDCLVSLPRPVGKSGLARILAGSLRAPVTPDKARHHGRLKALGEAAIASYIEDLVDDNRLRLYDRQGYPVLATTLRGRSEAERWLEANPLPVQPQSDEPSADDAQADGVAPGTAGAGETGEDAGEKYTALQKAVWAWRRRTAEASGQPPYMIMSNELILRIAEARPQTLDELAELPGMGAQRMEYYGPTILDLIHLNPIQPTDESLLAAQRTEQGTARRGQAGRAEGTPPISPQLQRKLFLKLQEMRQKIAIAERLRSQEVASTQLLRSIAELAPQSLDELHAVSGFSESRLRQIDTQILTFIHSARTTGDGQNRDTSNAARDPADGTE